MKNLLDKLAGSAKAIVALIFPFVIAGIVQGLTEASKTQTGITAAILTSAVVWLTPNKQQTTDNG